ncbi:MAG: DUF2339 domain-containing protein [Caldilineaceae bacterium]
MSDFFAGLSCFISFFLFVGLIGVVGWARGRLRQMQQQLDRVSEQVATSTFRPASSAAPIAATTQTEAPQVIVQPANQPPVTSEVVAPVAMPDRSILDILSDEERAKLKAPEAPPTPVVRPPAKPNPLIAWFTRMNIMVQIGLFVLFFGVAFLVKYAADQGWLSIELRLTGAALLGVALAGIGWRVRHKSRVYGLALIGGGIGIVYITTFGAYRLYELLPPTLTFAILVGLGVAYAVMALLNDAQILAFLALVGGLLAPILASSEGGSHVMLFSYYIVVNAGILAIAWFKSWRLLNLASFLLTLVAALAWGAAEYQGSLFNSTEPFLIVFYLFYLAVTVLTLRRDDLAPEQSRMGVTDLVLLFANPLVTFAMQFALVDGRTPSWLATTPFSDDKLWMARTALAMALAYAGLSLWAIRSWRRPSARSGFSIEAMLFLATFFLAISFPLLYDAQVTTASWALLAVAVHWLGVRRRQGWLHFWGIVVRLAATLAFLADIGETTRTIRIDDLPLFTNHIYVGAVILSLSSLLSAWLLHSERREDGDGRMSIYQRVGIGMLGWGLLWWFGSGLGEMILHMSNTNERYVISSMVAFVALSCLSAELIGGWLRWSALRKTLTGMLPMLALLALLQLGVEEKLWQGGNWYAWPLAIAVHLFALRRFEGWQSTKPRWQAFYHACGVWLMTFLLTELTVQWLHTVTTVVTWQRLPLLLIPTLALVGVFQDRLSWPLRTYPRWYGIVAALPLALYLVICLLILNIDLSGLSDPLPYLPVLNPLTLTMIAVFVTLWAWLRHSGQAASDSQREVLWGAKLALGALAFVAFNAGLARDVHHLTGVAFDWESLFASEVLQTTYAIVWSVIALVLMFWANRRGQRENGWSAVWYFGAAVLALTVLKLFLVDLANTGAIARIVSFMGVGLLIIVIAYFAPLPPQRKEIEEGAAG